MSAGFAQLELLDEEKPWNRLEEASARLEAGFRDALRKLDLNLTFNRVGSMMTVFFAEPQVKDFADATRSDTDRHAAFCLEMLQRGVYLAPSQFEALFISTAHTDEDIEKTIEASQASLKKVFSS